MNRNLRLQNPKCYSCILVQFNFSFTHPVGWWKQFLWVSLILVFQVCASVPNSSKTLGGRGRGEKDATRTLYKLGKGAASGDGWFFKHFLPLLSAPGQGQYSMASGAGAQFQPGQCAAGSRGWQPSGVWGQHPTHCTLHLSVVRGQQDCETWWVLEGELWSSASLAESVGDDWTTREDSLVQTGS